MKTLRVLALVGMISLAANLHSNAASLILTPGVPTDLNGSPLDVTYNATGGSFQVNGSLSDYITSANVDTGDFSGYGGYSISATIDKNTGNVASGGTVTISDYESDTLLTNRDLDEVRAHLRVEAVLVHAEVVWRISEADEAGQNHWESWKTRVGLKVENRLLRIREPNRGECHA